MTIRVVASEVVVPRGTARATWLVYHDGQWRSARDVPGAEMTQLDPKPGIVWHTEAVLVVDAGTWLQCVHRQPVESPYQDPLHYLEKEVRLARASVRRAYYRVTVTGKLARAHTSPPVDADSSTSDDD